MRPYLILGLFLTFLSCKDGQQDGQQVEKRVLSTELKYSAYGWYFDDKVDSFDFLLVHYARIDKEGRFNIMRRNDWKGEPSYYTGYINDTIRKLIDTVLTKKDYKENYLWNVDDGFTYDGYTYTFDFKRNGMRKFIHYIPRKSPKPIATLGLLLDTLINTATKQIDMLNIQPYIQELKNISWAMTPSPKVSKEKIEFVPPKISK